MTNVRRRKKIKLTVVLSIAVSGCCTGCRLRGERRGISWISMTCHASEWPCSGVLEVPRWIRHPSGQRAIPFHPFSSFVRPVGCSFVRSFLSPFFVSLLVRLLVCLFVRSWVACRLGRCSFLGVVGLCVVVRVRCSSFPFWSLAFGVFAASGCTCDEKGCQTHCVMIHSLDMHDFCIK